MRQLQVFILFAAVTLAVGVWALPARSSVRVELITIGPGDALWNAFGHTAIRVVERETGRDEIYNYGVANFGDPAFIWGFLRGRSRFRLAVYPWWETVVSSHAENRTLYRQVLNLSRRQARELADFLEWNARPDNAEYYYDHLLDNCSTRVRDAIDRVTRGALREAVADWQLDWTYRDYTLASGAGRFHFMLGLDLASGPNQSVVVDGWGTMYLPDYLMQGVGEAIIDDGQGMPLAQPPIVVFERRGPPAAQGSPHAARYLVVALALGLGLAFWQVGRRKQEVRRRGWLRAIGVRSLGLVLAAQGLLFGIFGTAYLVLGIVSVVPDTHWNENTWIFWTLDVFLVIPGLRALVGGRWWLGRWLRSYLLWRVGLLAAYALLKPTGWFPQDNWVFVFAVAVLFLGLALGARARPIAVEPQQAVRDMGGPSRATGSKMKGIIIGAGRGQRLMPCTEEQPKCFAELAGQRILDWVVDALRGGGLDDLVFIGGYRIEDVRGQYPGFDFRHNDEWASNNILASLFYAEDAMADGFVSSYSDIVYTSEAVRAVLAHPGDIVLAVDTAWRRRYERRSQHPESDAEKVVAEGDRIALIPRSTPSETAVGEFIGLAKFSARGASELRRHYHDARATSGSGPFRTAPSLRKAYLIDMLQELVDRGVELHLAPIDGGYYEIDTTEDYEIAQEEWPEVVANPRERS